MADIVDTGVMKGDIAYILEIGGFMLLVAIGGVLCSVAASFIASKVSAGFGKILRNKVFSHVQKFALHEFDKLGTASLITRTTNDITQVQQLLNMMLRLMIMAPMMCIGGIIMAVITDAKLSLVIVVVMPVLGLVIFAVLKQGMPLFKVMQIKIDTLNRVLRENLTGIRVVRSFNRVDYEKKRFNAVNLDLTDTAIKVNKIMASMMPLMMLIINFSTLAIVWFGGIRINNDVMQIGNLMAFIQYIMQILFAVMMVSMLFFMVPRASASAARIHEVLDVQPEIL
ncbi:MAG: multidrug transporter ATP-binding protein, partial [Bacilli bacterium]|nr:multidrug transporter ATP-binding protein [Bacilli bacterium]